MTDTSWDVQKWSSTLYVDRLGGTPNYVATVDGYGAPGAGTLSPWTNTNLGARYQWTNELQFSVNVRNLFNSMPPTDSSYPGTTSMPYNIYNYNVYGRSYYLGMVYQLGK